AIFSEGDLITVEDCDVPIQAEEYGEHLDVSLGGANGALPVAVGVRPGDMRQARTRVEQDMIRDALARFNGNKKKAAEHLGMSRAQLYKRLGQWQASAPGT